MKRVKLMFYPPTLALAGCALGMSAAAQQVSSVTLPNTPSAVVEPAAYSSSATASALDFIPAQEPAAHEDKQPKRILGIIPNFRAVSANEKLPPQTVKDKFITTTEDSFDYSAVILPAALAGEAQATGATPEFHGGAVGYGRYFWHTFVDQTSENYLVEFIIPAIRHEDSRYYTLGQGGFTKRAGYAVKHVFVTRSDGGKQVFNSGEIVGAAAASVLSNAYYPSAERSVGSTVQKFGTNVGIDAFTFVLKEFWPDINHSLFHAQ